MPLPGSSHPGNRTSRLNLDARAVPEALAWSPALAIAPRTRITRSRGPIPTPVLCLWCAALVRQIGAPSGARKANFTIEHRNSLAPKFILGYKNLFQPLRSPPGRFGGRGPGRIDFWTRRGESLEFGLWGGDNRVRRAIWSTGDPTRASGTPLVSRLN